MAKEFKYKGKTLEELQAMDIPQFAQIVPARQMRTLLRGFTEAQKRLLVKLNKKDRVKTHIKDIVVLPSMVGKTIGIHNGKTFVPIAITESHIGYYLGEFILTRTKVSHNAPGIGATKSSANVSVK